jgi:hypothetical protein
MKFLLALILTTTFSFKAMACSCAAWTDAQAVVDSAAGVYIAIPTEDSKPVFGRWPFPLPRRLPKLNKTAFKIIKTYKGTNADSLNIYHDPQVGTSCELNFEEQSGVFVIITYKVMGRQITEMCSQAAISPNNSMVTNFLNQL